MKVKIGMEEKYLPDSSERSCLCRSIYCVVLPETHNYKLSWMKNARKMKLELRPLGEPQLLL